ncbi:MAG: hypothetical protein U5L45_03900 [Saprospiraceae bacterium]|nr:hypothetical protein [Saprospiraceae bacterium]
MKKIFLIIWALLNCSLVIFAQKTHYKGLRILANTNYTNIVLGSQTTVGQPLNTTVLVVGKPNIGLSVEALFSLNKKLNLNIGLGANTLYFKQKIKGLTWGTDLDPQVGFRASTTYFDSRLIMVNLPLKLNYTLKTNQSLELGLITSLRLNKSGDFYTIRDDDNFKKIVSENSQILVKNVNLILAAGYNFSFRMKDKINLVIQPYAAIHVLGDNLKLFYVDNYMYQFGLNFGIELQKNKDYTTDKRKKKKIGA